MTSPAHARESGPVLALDVPILAVDLPVVPPILAIISLTSTWCATTAAPPAITPARRSLLRPKDDRTGHPAAIPLVGRRLGVSHQTEQDVAPSGRAGGRR